MWSADNTIDAQVYSKDDNENHYLKAVTWIKR